MKRLLLLLATLLFCVPALPADECPCVPTENMWVVKTCTDFNCAMTALAAANGNPLTFSIPVGTSDARWVVLQRVVAGAYTDDGSDPYQVETFDGVALATARMAAIDNDHRPMITTAPDGAFLVLSLKQVPAPRTRRANH